MLWVVVTMMVIIFCGVFRVGRDIGKTALKNGMINTSENWNS